MSVLRSWGEFNALHVPDTSVNHFFAATVGVLCHFDDSVSFTVSRCKFKSVTGQFFSDCIWSVMY